MQAGRPEGMCLAGMCRHRRVTVVADSCGGRSGHTWPASPDAHCVPLGDVPQHRAVPCRGEDVAQEAHLHRAQQAVGSTLAIMQQPVGTRLDQARQAQAARRRAGSTLLGQPPAAIPSSAWVATVAAPSRRQRQSPAGSSDSTLVADGSGLARQAALRPGGWGAPTTQVARAASAVTLTLWSTRSAGILRVLVLAKGTRTYSACSPSQPPCSQQVCARVWVLDRSASKSAGGHVHAAVHHTADQKMSEVEASDSDLTQR